MKLTSTNGIDKYLILKYVLNTKIVLNYSQVKECIAFTELHDWILFVVEQARTCFAGVVGR